MIAKYKVGDWISIKGIDANKKRAHILEIKGQECEAGVQIQYLIRMYQNLLMPHQVGWACATQEQHIREMEISGIVAQPSKDDKYET